MLSVRKSNRAGGPWHLGAGKAAAPRTQDDTPGLVLRAADPGIGPSLGRRLLDLAVAVVVLGLVWPLFLALVLATRLSTGSSAIYRQARVGQGGVPFTLFKFRTMRAGMAGPEVTAPSDHRVTRLGGLLRKTSADELPQLVNVLLGDMTLVGPRPETVALARRYPAELQFVFRYRPGITGPSQVLVRDEKVLGQVEDVESFYLNELVPHRVAMDLSYLREPTLARTIRWLADTALYLIRTAQPRSATPALPVLTGAAAMRTSSDELDSCCRSSA
jgi:lipopolysaccharide/colanic/teichoic acid biosynthesis glycosyltransferase